MPRRKRQFSFLERALKAAGGVATTGVLAEFSKFKAGVNKKKAGAIPAAARKRVLYSINPFGNVTASLAAVPDTGKYKVAISQWSNDWRTGAGKISNTDIGYDTIKAANQSDPSFYPAWEHPDFASIQKYDMMYCFLGKATLSFPKKYV